MGHRVILVKSLKQRQVIRTGKKGLALKNDLDKINLDIEYALIQAKKSKLTRSRRDAVVALINKNQEGNHA